MIRKQLYITAAHDAELKARAGAALVTEAEIVRAALDAAFGFGKSQTAAQARALEAFITTAEAIRNRNRPTRARVYLPRSVYNRFLPRPRFYKDQWIL